MKRASHKKTIFFVIIVKSIIEVILLHVHCTCIVTKRRIYVRAEFVFGLITMKYMQQYLFHLMSLLLSASDIGLSLSLFNGQ